MKTSMRIVFVTILLGAIMAYAQKYPESTGYVNDFANLFTREQGISLNNELAAFEKKTTIEIAVVTVPWLNNQSVRDYAEGLAKEWGVGKRGQNNGIIFLIAPKERKMLIEPASGARVILTDSRANQIRDNTVLPYFKSGNMAQGIIKGTYAIMQVFDASFVSVTNENMMVSAQQSTHREEAPNNKSVPGYMFGSVIGIAVLCFLVIPPIRGSKARKYVLENKKLIEAKFTEANELAKSPDVKEETRKKFTKLKDEFSSINRLTVKSKGIKWLEVREKLDPMGYSFDLVISSMKREIAFAEKARKEGPALLKKIPDIIKAAEKKLSEGKPSLKAVKYLENVQKQYAQVQSRQSEMTITDWVVLYMILTNIQSGAANAESIHQHENTGYSSNYSSESNYDSNSSYGFGDSGGFGGGGGFDGGGSEGSW